MADIESRSAVDLTNAGTLAKFERASAIANAVIAKVVESSAPGTLIAELCALGDRLIAEGCAPVTDPENPKMEKGISFPTCVSVNNCVANYSPDASSKTKLAEGDLVKVELGVHIDGYAAVGAHTYIATSKPEEAVKGRRADAVCAAYFALDAAVKLCRPGNTNTQITTAIADIAKEFQCSPVKGLISHSMERFVLEGDKVIDNKATTEDRRSKEEEFEVGEIYGLTVVMSTGEGQASEKSEKPSVFRRDPDVRYNLKMKSARQVFTEIRRNSPAYPFAVRSLKTRGAKLGLGEMQKHDMLKPYPVLFEKPGEFVALFKTTVLIQKHQIARIVNHAPAFVQSEYSVKDEKLAAILQQSLSLEQ